MPSEVLLYDRKRSRTHSAFGSASFSRPSTHTFKPCLFTVSFVHVIESEPQPTVSVHMSKAAGSNPFEVKLNQITTTWPTFDCGAFETSSDILLTKCM